METSTAEELQLKFFSFTFSRGLGFYWEQGDMGHEDDGGECQRMPDFEYLVRFNA